MDEVRWYDLTIRFGVVNGEIVVENAPRFTEEVSKRVAELVPVKYVGSVELVEVAKNPGAPERPGRGRKVSGNAPGGPGGRASETTAPAHDLYQVFEVSWQDRAACRRCGQTWIMDFVGWQSPEQEAADMDCTDG